MTLTTSRPQMLATQTQVNPIRSTEQEVRSAKPTARRPSFLMTLLRALAASAA